MTFGRSPSLSNISFNLQKGEYLNIMPKTKSLKERVQEASYTAPASDLIELRDIIGAALRARFPMAVGGKKKAKGSVGGSQTAHQARPRNVGAAQQVKTQPSAAQAQAAGAGAASGSGETEG